MTATSTMNRPIEETPAGAASEESAARLVEIRHRRRMPWLVAITLGALALVLAVALLAPTTTGLTQKLADVCTAAGPNVPADARPDCAQAQRGEVPVRAAGVPGLDGKVAETPVTVPPARPGAPSTVIYPPDAGLPGALPAVVPPGAISVPGPVVTVTSVPPRETVTVAAPPPAASTETVTLAQPPETVTRTVAGDPPPAQTRTETSTVTETVTVTQQPPPPPPPSSEQPPPPPETVTTTDQPPAGPGGTEPAAPLVGTAVPATSPVPGFFLLGWLASVGEEVPTWTS